MSDMGLPACDCGGRDVGPPRPEAADGSCEHPGVSSAVVDGDLD